MVEKEYYTLTEVTRFTQLKPHILRYWEKEFPQLRPRRNIIGRRIYSKDDLSLILLIKKLLYEEGYTIQGAREKIGVLKELSSQLGLPLNKTKEGLLLWVKEELIKIRDSFEKGSLPS